MSEERSPSTSAADPLASTSIEEIPSKPGGISALASAAAPFVYFDTAPFGSQHEGIGGVTLMAGRQAGALPDGRIPGDFVVVAHLRGSLQALIQLRDTINDVLLHAATPETVNTDVRRRGVLRSKQTLYRSSPTKQN